MGSISFHKWINPYLVEETVILRWFYFFYIILIQYFVSSNSHTCVHAFWQKNLLYMSCRFNVRWKSKTDVNI